MRRSSRLLFLSSLLAVTAFDGATRAATNFNVTNSGATSYVIGAANDPTLPLTRGQTYTFTVTATGHPFFITTAPATLFYQCGIHDAMVGTLTIVTPPSVPALGPFGIVVLAMLVLLVGTIVLRRRGTP